MEATTLHEQRMAALGSANDIRTRRSQLCQGMKRDRARLVDVLADPSVATMRLVRLLGYLPAVNAQRPMSSRHREGGAKQLAKNICRAAGVGTERRIGWLTDREIEGVLDATTKALLSRATAGRYVIMAEEETTNQEVTR